MHEANRISSFEGHFFFSFFGFSVLKDSVYISGNVRKLFLFAGHQINQIVSYIKTIIYKLNYLIQLTIIF